MGAIRDRAAIQAELGMSDDVFEELESNYRDALLCTGKRKRGWNDEIDEMAATTGTLSDEEILLARDDLDRAILNRIIVNRAMRHRVPPRPTAPDREPIMTRLKNWLGRWAGGRPEQPAPPLTPVVGPEGFLPPWGPRLLASTVIREGQTDRFGYALHGDCEAISFGIRYHYLLFCWSLESGAIEAIYASESSKGPPFLCLFVERRHLNLGSDPAWGDANAFFERAIALATARFAPRGH